MIEVFGVYLHDLVSNPATFASEGQNLQLSEANFAQILKTGQKWTHLGSYNLKFWPLEAKVAGFDTKSWKYTPKTSIKVNISCLPRCKFVNESSAQPTGASKMDFAQCSKIFLKVLNVNETFTQTYKLLNWWPMNSLRPKRPKTGPIQSFQNFSVKQRTAKNHTVILFRIFSKYLH